MTNYTWKAQPGEYAIKIDSLYAKNISLAWVNWELNQLEERTQIQRKTKK